MVLSTFNRELYEKELKEDAREEGRQEGETLGANKKLLEIAKRLEERGKTAEEIAELLGEDLAVIRDGM